jgi:predicted RNA-binding protein YlxR (DUF448 family)
MAGKYLSQNCLCVDDSTAAEAVNKFLSANSSTTYTSTLNRSSHERSSFLKSIKITK